MSIVSRICASLEARLNQPWVSVWRTVYFNLRTLPFKQAIKLPVFIYGRVRLFGLNGNVRFENTEIKRGMVKIGRNADSFTLNDGSGYILLGSKSSLIVFEGPASIALNSKTRVVEGELRFGKYTFIGSNVRIICNGGKIKIGDYSRIAFESVIMNSGFHHVYNSNKKSVVRATRPISIGEYSWVGNRTTVSAGAKTKSHTIVCAGSIVNKDYSIIEGENQMLGGSPAKLIGCGFHRIFSPKLEESLITYFKLHPNEDIYHIENFIDEETEIKSEF